MPERIECVEDRSLLIADHPDPPFTATPATSIAAIFIADKVSPTVCLHHRRDWADPW